MARKGESKYDALGRHLRNLTVNRVELTFDEIEEITGVPLTYSARSYAVAWSNSRNGGAVIINQWLDAGWRVVSKNLGDERVVFERAGTPSSGGSIPAARSSDSSAQDLARVSVRCLMTLEMGPVIPTASEYGYANPVLCAIDAVWSLGVRYEAVRNAVASYVRWMRGEGVDALASTHSPAQAVSLLEGLEPEEMTGTVFANRHRTSTRSGILKAEAVRRYLHILADAGVASKHDVEGQESALGAELRSVRGQGSGTSTEYFFMLCGSEARVKPDRMIQRFVEDAIGRAISAKKAASLVVEAAGVLSEWVPGLTPRALDRSIWAYQREQTVE